MPEEQAVTGFDGDFYVVSVRGILCRKEEKLLYMKVWTVVLAPSTRAAVPQHRAHPAMTEPLNRGDGIKKKTSTLPCRTRERVIY